MEFMLLFLARRGEPGERAGRHGRDEEVRGRAREPGEAPARRAARPRVRRRARPRARRQGVRHRRALRREQGGVGGFWIVDVASREEAIEIARRSPHARYGTVEVHRAVAPGSRFADSGKGTPFLFVFRMEPGLERSRRLEDARDDRLRRGARARREAPRDRTARGRSATGARRAARRKALRDRRAVRGVEGGGRRVQPRPRRRAARRRSSSRSATRTRAGARSRCARSSSSTRSEAPVRYMLLLYASEADARRGWREIARRSPRRTAHPTRSRTPRPRPPCDCAVGVRCSATGRSQRPASRSSASSSSRRRTSTRRSRSRSARRARGSARSRSAPCGRALIDRAEIERFYREEFGRVLATVIRLVGDFHVAEEAVQDAFAVALERWPREGRPRNPRAWLVATARHKAIDVLRRAGRFEAHPRRARAHARDRAASPTLPDAADAAIPDERLRLIFTCCHPALALEAQVALALRTLCGLSTDEIARAFLVRAGDAGAAPGARQAQDRRRRHPLRGAAARAARPSASRR